MSNYYKNNGVINGDSYAAVEWGAGGGRETIISFGVALWKECFENKHTS